MLSTQWSVSGGQRVLAILILTLALSTFGCSGDTKRGKAGSTPAPPANNIASSETHESGSPGSAIDIKDPDRFQVTMTISAQEINADPAKMQTLQFNLSEFDADRRWAFTLPALGQVVYLEKSGLKYLVLADRKQYFEVASDELGLQIERALTPSAVANQLKSRARIEALGVEPVNGRTARKYRVKDADDKSLPDGMIYVDIETGLPVRIEINTHPSSGGDLRVIAEARDIHLNPDRALFDVPPGMKKVSLQDAKQSVEAFGVTIRSFASMMSGMPVRLPTASTPAPNKSAANKNAAARR